MSTSNIASAQNVSGHMQSSIQTTYRTDRSIPMYLLQSLLKPFKPRFIESSKEYPGLSTKLKAPRGAITKCEINERKVAGLRVYDIRRKGTAAPIEKVPTSDVKIKILYYAGGGFQLPASSQHWNLLTDFVNTKCPSSTVSLISYPLAPDNSAKDAFETTVLCSEELIAAAKASGEKVILMGDSAGGNLAAAIALDLLRKHTSQEREPTSPEHTAIASTYLPLPNAIILISPSVDLTRSNPEIDKIARLDPLFTASASRNTAAARLGSQIPKHHGKHASRPPAKDISISSHPNIDDAVPSQHEDEEWTPLDSRLSPLYTPSPLLTQLATHDIAVHGVIGTYDVLSADALKFRDRCAAASVRGEWLVWEKQMHCFPIVKGYFAFAEVEGAGEWIGDVVGREMER